MIFLKILYAYIKPGNGISDVLVNFPFLLYRYNGKLLDLSQPFRFTGLINNSKVEMVKVEKSQSSQVIVAVQLENGERIQVTVDPTKTLSNIFEAAGRSSPA